MADECISVKFPGQDEYWNWCWENTTPEPTWAVENVTTGLRKGQGADARAWRTCQYYLKGLSAICSNWVQSDGVWHCNRPDLPTGFNNGVCDNLGRRSWCDQYTPSTDDNLDEWICAAPNGYLTGLGKRAEGTESPIIRVLNRSEIEGYNDDGNGVGLCDCNGFGRGSAGCKLVPTDTDDEGEEGEESSYGDTNVEAELLALPVVCNYYRPWTMGFGAITPRPRHLELSPEDEMDAAVAAIDEPLALRLPLSVILFNTRARFQKCNYWEEDYSSDFVLYDNRIIILEDMIEESIFDANGRIEMCKCTDSAADDYNHRRSSTTSVDFMTGLVQAQGEGLICNGAKPECPCYTGKWVHCIQDKMTVGMPVTANQVLELRFWGADWETRTQYDNFYAHFSNFDDPKTSDIYTFTKWDRRSTSAHENRMIGKRLNLCFPIVAENKEFTENSIFVDAPIEYVPSYIETGTTITTQVHFPTLLRAPEFEEVRSFAVDYPPFCDTYTSLDCGDGDDDGCAEPGHLKRSNNIYGDYSTLIGYGVRNKTVYAVNSAELHVDVLIKEYTSMLEVPEPLKDYILFKLVDTAFKGLTSASEYFVYGTCDSIFNYYILPPIKLKYNQENKILIMIDYGDGKWEFRWRIVKSLWCGGVITQTEYDHTYLEDGYDNNQPLSLSPAASAKFKMEGLSGCEPADLISVYSHEPQSSFYSIRYYSYSIISTEKTVTEIPTEEGEVQDLIRWWALGNSNMAHIEIEDTDLNYIYDWDIISAKMTPTPDKIKELEKQKLSTDPIPMEQYKHIDNTAIDSHTVPPNYKLLRPVDYNNVRHRFFSSEWYLEIEYWCKTLTTEDPSGLGDDVTVEHGAGKTDADRYVVSPISIDQSSDRAEIDDINQGTVNLLAYFNDTDGRLISTMATKACLNIVRESCRNIEIFYAYKAQGTKYDLMPKSGFCINIAADQPSSIPYMHGETPDCGTHYYFPWLQPGPQWFPFDNCRGYDMYDEWTICNNCQTGYAGPMNDGVLLDSAGNPQLAGGIVIKRKDYRYCGPYKYEAFGEVRSVNAVAACNCGCEFSYSDASTSTVIFAGYGNIKPAIDIPFFKSQGWISPPFGNEGREIIEKFISQDFITHPYGVGGTRSEWMPMVMDNSMFFMSFNAYDSNPEDTYFITPSSLDPFYYVNQMNFLLLQSINERIAFTPHIPDGPPSTEIRYRFEDLFEIHHEAICSYPLPAYPIIGSDTTKVIFYYLKQVGGKDITWAWQEFWKDIERGQSWTLEQAVTVVRNTTTNLSEDEVKDAANKILIDSGHLDFVRTLNKPDYVFSYYKEEHRFITEEGDHYVEYTAPLLDDEGNIAVHATISIDGDMARPFEIIYGTIYNSNNYSDDQVEWMDEDGDANVDGSSQEDNIYEKADGDSSEWLHDKDTLFTEADESTSAAAAAGREIVTHIDGLTGQETKKYYNIGLVVDMPKSRLDYLPKRERELVYQGSGIFLEEGVDDGIQISTLASLEYSPSSKEDPKVEGNYVWRSEVSFVYNDPDNPINLYGLRVVGLWGNKLNAVSVKPGISIVATYQDGSTGVPRMFNSVPTDFSYGTTTVDEELDLYVLEVQFLLGPIEMITNRMVGFVLTLEGSPKEIDFLSIQDIRLTTAEYLDKKIEAINVWERKYIASQYDKGLDDINLDASDNLYRNTDDYNSGLYFPFKGAGSKSRPDEELSGFNKTKAIFTGLLHTVSDPVEITYDNLHSVEEFEQQRLYEYATERDDSGSTIIYTGIMPYKVTTFLEDLSLPWDNRSAWFTSETLEWEKHELYKQFELYDYWRPGGHFYRWAPKFQNIRCMLFGGTHDFYNAQYVHVDHQGIGTPLEQDASKPIDILNSFGSLRHYTQIAKYDRAMILAGGDPEYTDKWSASTPYNGLSFIRSGDLAPDS